VAIHSGLVRRGVLIVVLIDLVIIAAAATRFPIAVTAPGGVLSLVAVAVAPLLCLALSRYGPLSVNRTPDPPLRIGVTIGAIAGLGYGLEGVAEYLSPALTSGSVATGWVIVAALVASHLVAGYLGARRAGGVGNGIRAALWNAVTEYLLWYPFVLGSYVLAAGSAASDRVMLAEGTIDDFHRSGMTSLDAFALQDLWGAGFFHLLAAMVLALLFGAPAALLGSRFPARKATLLTQKP